jgi:S-layer protein
MSTDTTSLLVTNYYETILNRTPSADEVTAWTNLIDQGILTDEQVLADFVLSPEAQQNVVPVVELYQAVLGRVPDQAGLQAWVGAESAGLSLQQQAQDLLSSAEGQAIYGSGTDITVAFLSALYENVFNRAPDTAGLNAWLSQSSVLSRADVVVDFITSAEGQADLNPLANQFLTAVGQDATNAYSGSLYADAPQPQGSTVALTTGVDLLTGTAGDDTFIGTVNPGIPSYGEGGPTITNVFSNSTLNPGDSIDGGAGSNTLQIVDSSGYDNNDLAGVTLTNIQTIALENTTSYGASIDLSANPGVSKVVALNTAGGGYDYFTGLATGTQVIASGAATGTEDGSISDTYVYFDMAKPTDAVSVGVDGGANGVYIESWDDSNAATAATITSTGAANGTSDNPDYFDLTGFEGDGNGTLKTLTVNADTNLVAGLTSNDYATGAALTVSWNATSVDLGSAVFGPYGTLNFKTIDASGLINGGLTITAGSSLTSLTGGAGDDVITLTGTLGADATINLGAGDDKLLSTHSFGGTILNGATIDGGAGTNTLSSALVNAGNASDFTNFQDLALESTDTFDVATLVPGIQSLSVDTYLFGDGTYTGLSQTDSLTDTFADNNNFGGSVAVTTLNFTDVSGTNDSYTITFDAPAQASTTTVNLGEIDAAGIENFNIASDGGAHTANTLTLGADSSAQTVTITGSQALTLNFASGFGSTDTPATGVSLIDGSQATGSLTVNLANVTAAKAGLTVNDGSGHDTITTSSFASTLVAGSGTDTYNIAATTVGDPANPVFTTIDNAIVGDKIQFLTSGADTGFTATAVDVSTATSLSAALNLATAADYTAGSAAVDWFNYAGNTYVVDNAGASTSLDGSDVIAKLSGGSFNLANSAYDTSSHMLTLAA